MNEQQQAKILLNNEVKVTDHRSQLVGQTGIVEGITESGFLKVALDDVNQYGPHAMIVLLGIVAAATAAVLMVAMFLT